MKCDYCGNFNSVWDNQCPMCKKNRIKYHFWYILKTLIILSVVALFCMLISLESYASEVIDTIVYEASGESFEGQVAVASVIKTRMKERGKTAKEIVLQRKQFSCWNNGQPTQKRTLNREERQTAEEAWNTAEAGEYNHYARYDCKPYWAKHAKLYKRIGNHIFYKL